MCYYYGIRLLFFNQWLWQNTTKGASDLRKVLYVIGEIFISRSRCELRKFQQKNSNIIGSFFTEYMLLSFTKVFRKKFFYILSYFTGPFLLMFWITYGSCFTYYRCNVIYHLENQNFMKCMVNFFNLEKYLIIYII